MPDRGSSLGGRPTAERHLRGQPDRYLAVPPPGACSRRGRIPLPALRPTSLASLASLAALAALAALAELRGASAVALSAVREGQATSRGPVGICDRYLLG